MKRAVLSRSLVVELLLNASRVCITEAASHTSEEFAGEAGRLINKRRELALAKYKKLQEDKDEAVAAVKSSGLGLMKAVKAANKKK